MYDSLTMFSCYFAIVAGLGITFLLLALHQRALPALPFSICMPALSLLLVFRTNTGYARWNEARTLWGGVINNCVC